MVAYLGKGHLGSGSNNEDGGRIECHIVVCNERKIEACIRCQPENHRDSCQPLEDKRNLEK